MPSRRKSWERGRKRPGPLRERRRILILCEDEKSSVLYLKKFPVDQSVVEVACEGTGSNTDTLMEEAIRRKEAAVLQRQRYQEIWVVFDRDSFPADRWHRSFQLAQSHPDIIVCWSNECFELWYLLHFALRDTAMPRREIFRQIGEKIGRSYDKADGSIYEALIGKLPDALRNAAKLEQMNATSRCARENPSTQVHKLVKKLQSLSPQALDR